MVEDVDLGLTVDDSVRWGAENGDWEHELSGRLLRVWSTYRPDYLDRVTASLDLDFSTDPPSVVGGAITYMNSTSEPVTQFVERGTLELQSADMSGVIAGRWIGETDAMVSFWVDLSEYSHAEIELGEPFSLLPGGYGVWNASTVFQYRAVGEDSRCPPDVTCVWEGRVEVEGHIWDIEDERHLLLRGILTEDGPVYGTQPSDRFRNGLTISLVGLDAGLATFIVEQSGRADTQN